LVANSRSRIAPVCGAFWIILIEREKRWTFSARLLRCGGWDDTQNEEVVNRLGNALTQEVYPWITVYHPQPWPRHWSGPTSTGRSVTRRRRQGLRERLPRRSQ